MPCVGGIVVHSGRLLLVRRGQAPSKGLWSVPGGRLLDGEDVRAGCERELLEETGLRVTASRLVGTVERDAPDGRLYVIDDLLCALTDAAPGSTPPEPIAGDDAADAAWFSRSDVERCDAEGRMAPGVLEALHGWGVLDLLDG